MGCCEFFTKCLYAGFATIFLICGIAFVAYGSFAYYIISTSNGLKAIQELGTIIPSIFTIVFGISLIILVGIGYCGIFKESSCCLQSYCYLLLFLAITQIVFGIYCVVEYNTSTYKANLQLQIGNHIAEVVTNYTDNSQTVDDIQRALKCCGHQNPLSEYNKKELPLTCCASSKEVCTEHNIYKESCSSLVYLLTWQTNYIMGWISLTIGCTQFIVSMLGICLFCCIWRN